MKRFALALVLCIALPALAAPATVGGKVAPDGTPLQLDLPGQYHQENIASKGLGCCVFRSIDHAAHYQLIEALYDMPEWMVKRGIAGGGWPEKTDKLIAMICTDRGLPVPDYIQVEGPWSQVKSVIELAAKTNRFISITYGRSPTGRYNGRPIAHMVNMNHAAGGWYSFLDNNYLDPREKSNEWCNEKEASWAASYGSGSVWAVIFIEPSGPPPVPRPFKDHDYEEF